MKGRWKKAFTLIGATAILAASAFSMSCGSEPDSTIPDGWEVVSTDGNLEYLSLMDGWSGQKLTHNESLTASEISPSGDPHSAGSPEKITAYDASDMYVYGLADGDYCSVSDSEDLKLIYYYGGIPNDYTSKVQYQVNVQLIDSLGFLRSSRLYNFDLQTSDVFDVGQDKDGNLYARHAVRITIPASDLKKQDYGRISVWIQFPGEEGSSGLQETVVEQEQSFRYYHRGGKIWISDPSLDIVEYVRTQFPFTIYEAWDKILPGILIAEIVLFALSLFRKRYFTPFLAAPAAVGLLGLLFAYAADHHYAAMKVDKSDMFNGLTYMKEQNALFLWMVKFVIGTVILFVIFAILHHVRQKRMWKKMAAQSAEQQEITETEE